MQSIPFRQLKKRESAAKSSSDSNPSSSSYLDESRDTSDVWKSPTPSPGQVLDTTADVPPQHSVEGAAHLVSPERGPVHQPLLAASAAEATPPHNPSPTGSGGEPRRAAKALFPVFATPALKRGALADGPPPIKGSHRRGKQPEDGSNGARRTYRQLFLEECEGASAPAEMSGREATDAPLLGSPLITTMKATIEPLSPPGMRQAHALAKAPRSRLAGGSVACRRLFGEAAEEFAPFPDGQRLFAVGIVPMAFSPLPSPRAPALCGPPNIKRRHADAKGPLFGAPPKPSVCRRLFHHAEAEGDSATDPSPLDSEDTDGEEHVEAAASGPFSPSASAGTADWTAPPSIKRRHAEAKRRPDGPLLVAHSPVRRPLFVDALSGDAAAQRAVCRGP